MHARTVIVQSDEARALDWYGVEMHGDTRYRWSGPNPRPKILIPYTGGRAGLQIEIIAKPPDAELRELLLHVEEQQIDYDLHGESVGPWRLTCEIPLKGADYTVLELATPMFYPDKLGASEDTRKLGIAVADIVIEPI